MSIKVPMIVECELGEGNMVGDILKVYQTDIRKPSTDSFVRKMVSYLQCYYDVMSTKVMRI